VLILSKIESVSPEGNFIKSKLAHISQQTHSALSRSQLEVDDVLFSIAGAMGRSAVVDSSLLPANTNQALAIIRLKTDLISPIYLSHLLRSSQILSYVTSIKTGVAQYNLSLQQVGDIKIPLPPIAIQQEIVTEIENYQKVINGARAVIDNYRPHIPINSDWAIVELGEVLTLQRGYDLPKQEWKEGSYPIVGSNGIIGFHNTYKEIGPGVVTGRSGTIGKVHYIDASHYWPHNTSLFVKDFKGNDPKFVLYLLKSVDLKSLGERTAAVPSLDRKNAHRLKVSLPPLEIQKAIVAEIEAEQTLVNANRELITRFEKKIQTTLNRIWGEE
jgi:Restriction endonuclease S subunits